MAEPAILVLNPSALDLGLRLKAALPASELHSRMADDADVVIGDDLGAHLRQLFVERRPLIGVCAAGILIRALAPLLVDKHVEPPVVAVAQDGASVVPLLGGHHGANRLAAQLAAVLDGHAAITTASLSAAGPNALEDPPAGWSFRATTDVKPLLARLRDGGQLVLDDTLTPVDWLDGTQSPAHGHAVDVDVTISRRSTAPAALIPRLLALGVGCERGVDPQELGSLVEAVLDEHDLDPRAIAAVASLDLKAGEPAVRALADRFDVPLRVFDAAALERETPRLLNPSAIVHREVGCHGVAEAAALAVAGGAAELLVPKTKSARATAAIAQASDPIDPAGAGRSAGRLKLLSLGPGARGERSLDVDWALRRCTDLVGYAGYLDLLEPAIGARRHGFGLGREADRCRHALTLALEGGNVGLVGSGDVGVYAMAALVHEIAASEPAFQTVPIEVYAGISAMHAAAARVGAPLGHDFCAISLSDLLTPWWVIETRLRAAASADFVIGLYNPVSAARREGFKTALAILSDARPAGTPCVVARQIGRDDERINVVTLEHLGEQPIDMLTLVLIGNGTTRFWEDAYGRRHVFTPRGYATA